MANTKLDARQIISRDALQHIFPAASNKELDDILRSIDAELKPPLRLDAGLVVSENVLANAGDGDAVIDAVNDWVGQAFTTGSDAYELDKVTFELKAGVGTPVGTLKVHVYSDAAGLPDEILGTSEDFDVVALTASGQDVVFGFNKPVSVAASTKFHVVIASEDLTTVDGSNTVDVRQDSGDPIAGGDQVVSTDGGSSWGETTGTDCICKIEGLTIQPSSTRKIRVGPTIITGPSGRQRSIPHVGSVIPTMLDGIFEFPSTSGGTVTLTPGTNTTLTLPTGEYVKVLLYLDSIGELNIIAGNTDADVDLAQVTPFPQNTLPMGYAILFNNGGTIETINQDDIYQFGNGAGGGSGGSGSGTGDDINTLKFAASFSDTFFDSDSVDISAGFTDDALRSVADALYQLNYDADKTIASGSTGTAAVLSAAPAFTVKVGDVLITGGEARRITVIGSVNSDGGSGTPMTLEAAFDIDPTIGDQATISQVVYTVDANNFNDSGAGTSIADSYPGSLSTYILSYRDSETVSDIVHDEGDPANVAYSASSDGSAWSDVATRVDAYSTSNPIKSLPSTGTSFYLRFFSAKTSGSGTVNLLDYKVYLHEEEISVQGDILNQAWCRTDGAGAEVNCSVTSDTGKTRISMNWDYGVGVLAGEPGGQIEVWLDGKKIPRFLDSTLTPASYYLEIDENTIELDDDYSGSGLSVEIKKPVAIIDETPNSISNIASLQSLQECGFQNFIKESFVDAPNTEIINRAQVRDMSNDMGAKLGIERISIQTLEKLQEFGSTGELVQKVTNDSSNRIRFVGNWQTQNGNHGQAHSLVTGWTVGYIEVTFYGTGLNLLVRPDSNAGRTVTVKIDGGSVSGDKATTAATVLNSRKYSINAPINLASELAEGLHTAKIEFGDNSGSILVYGIEVLNENTQIKVQPGTAFLSGKKTALSAQQSIDYNAGFESIIKDGASSGSVGTRGGYALIYQKSDGTVAKALTATNTSQANLGSADHSNEEVIRNYNFREFGANRADDFSTEMASISDRVFTLDDGTTTLAGDDVLVGKFSGASKEGLFSGTSADFISFTFVGTGLDIVEAGNTSTINTVYSVFIDGISIATDVSIFAGLDNVTHKIVSGLPYGTHTVKIVRGAGGNGGGIGDFIVYGPKKPALPSGAMELESYYLMADFVANTAAGNNEHRHSSGTLIKTSVREMIYTGTITGAFLNANEGGGSGWVVSTNSPTTGQTWNYTAFGTGFEIWARGGSSGFSTTIKIDGVAYTGAATPGNSSGTWTSGTSTWATGTSFGGKLIISGLALGIHTVEMTITVNAGNCNLTGIGVITPIHSPSSNLPANLQNTLSVGSNALMDLRKFSPIDEKLDIPNWSKAVGIENSPSTTSSSYVPVPDMSCIVKTNGGPLDIRCIMAARNSGNINVFAIISIDGITENNDWIDGDSTDTTGQIAMHSIVPVSAGTHIVQIFWNTSSGTAVSDGIRRVLLVEEKK